MLANQHTGAYIDTSLAPYEATLIDRLHCAVLFFYARFPIFLVRVDMSLHNRQCAFVKYKDRPSRKRLRRQGKLLLNRYLSMLWVLICLISVIFGGIFCNLLFILYLLMWIWYSFRTDAFALWCFASLPFHHSFTQYWDK